MHGDRGTDYRSGQAAFIFWTDPPVNVYADPCAKEPLDPPAGDIPAELAAAVSSIPGTDLVDGPTDVTIGGHPAKHVTIRVRDDIDCPPGEFLVWYNEVDGQTGGHYPDAVGDTINLWIIDVDGTIVWIDARGQAAPPDAATGYGADRRIDPVRVDRSKRALGIDEARRGPPGFIARSVEA